MFQKDGSSTLGGKKDAPLRKSDRRRLRDRALAVLLGPPPNADGNDDGGPPPPAWVERATRLVDDALTSSAGDVLSRKLRLAGGESATLFLRTPSKQQGGSAAPAGRGGEREESPALDVIRDSYPTEWPYRTSAQPVLLEYEDGDRKVHLVPLLPLLAALPPPALVSGGESHPGYRIPDVAVHPAVSKYVCRGADLMRSGVRSFPSPSELRRSPGGLVTVSAVGNPQPLAVGFVDASLFGEHCRPRNGKGLQREQVGGTTPLVGPGTSGVAVKIVTCYGDDLWRRAAPPRSKAGGEPGGTTNPLGGGRYDDGNFGNVGFDGGRYVHPIMETGGGGSSDEEEEEEEEENDEEATESQADEETAATADGMEQLTVADDAAEEGEAAEAPPEEAEAGSEEAGSGEAEADEAAVDHDAILLAAFYTSLLRMLQSKAQFPVPVSTYYAKHLLPSVPASGPRLDLKSTRHKKIGPFLAEMERDGVVTLGPSRDGRDRCAFLAGVNRKSRELIMFKREHWDKEGGGATSSADGGKATRMGAVDLFIVPSRIVDGMRLDGDAVSASGAKAEERRGTGYLTRAECRGLVEGYVEREGLVDPNGKGRVLVDGPLCDALFKVGKKRQQKGEAEEYPTSIKRKDLVERWLDKMEKGHAIVQMPGSRILSMGRGEPKPVEIEVEFRQGNRRKFLTRVRGMEEYGIDGPALARDVSHRFACSGSAESDPVGRPALRKGRVEIVFQGHLSEEIGALLVGDDDCAHGGAREGGYNLPKSVVRVSLRKGVPAKKKR